tara:strand:+ start:362 stop:769 length:408 start_codon:yes stop_codon:yes gene_type:complete
MAFKMKGPSLLKMTSALKDKRKISGFAGEVNDDDHDTKYGAGHTSHGEDTEDDMPNESVPALKQKQEHEGAETMGSEQLRNEFDIEGLESSTDYYIKRGDGNEPMILGEVDLEDGDVTGVPGSTGGKLTRESDPK